MRRLLSLKFSRLISFFLFWSREGLENSFGSFISPSELGLQHNLDLAPEIMRFNQLLRPKRLKNRTLKRYGSVGDGGYFLIEQDYSDGLLLSGGIEKNNDFEHELAVLGIKGIQIDFSIEKAPKEHSNLFFYPYKISGNVRTAPNERTLDEILFEFEREKGFLSKNKILKLDIEGSEWEAIAVFDRLQEFDQILLELHSLNRMNEVNFREKVLECLDKINQTHFATYIEGNNCCGFSVIAGNPVANVLEVGFAKKEKYDYEDFELPGNNITIQTGNYPNRAKLNINGIWG